MRLSFLANAGCVFQLPVQLQQIIAGGVPGGAIPAILVSGPGQQRTLLFAPRYDPPDLPRVPPGEHTLEGFHAVVRPPAAVTKISVISPIGAVPEHEQVQENSLLQPIDRRHMALAGNMRPMPSQTHPLVNRIPSCCHGRALTASAAFPPLAGPAARRGLFYAPRRVSALGSSDEHFSLSRNIGLGH